MSDKLVWSNNATLNSLLALSEDDLKAELIDYGYSEDFISDMSLDELHNILREEETLWEMDVDDFENNIVPMINKQTDNGIVLMVGEAERWDGKHKGGKAVFTEDLKGGDIDPDVVDVDIYDDGDGLVWLGHHHDGTHRFKLYALPEDDRVEFVRNCMEDAIEDQYNWYHEGEDFADVEEDVLEEVLGNFTDLDYLTENINFSQVPNYCKPIKNLLNESLNEDKSDNIAITVDAVLDDNSDLDAIRQFNIEPKYSDYKAYDNLKLVGSKENIIKYLKSDLYNADDEWIKEYYPELLEEELNEASTKEPKKLKKEIKEIKGLVDNYGLKYITSMPFTSFDNDPTSIEYNYPEFFKIVKSFYKEMELASKEDLADNDLLDEYWDVDFDNYDYDVVMRVCDKLVSRPGVPVQIEKIYKTGYNSPLDDEDILADRERQDELAAQYGESLNEARYDLLDKRGYPIGSYTDRDKAMKAAKEKEDELGSVVIHDRDSVKKYDKKYTGWSKQNESLNEDSDYIVVRGVKVPKEYFEKYPGLTNFEVRDKFLADEEEESPYMHADDIEFDEALTEGVKIPKTWLVTDKLDQQFKVRNGNHFYTEEDVKDYYPDVTKVEVVEYFTEDELDEKPWMIDNFNDHKKLIK